MTTIKTEEQIAMEQAAAAGKRNKQTEAEQTNPVTETDAPAEENVETDEATETEETLSVDMLFTDAETSSNGSQLGASSILTQRSSDVAMFIYNKLSHEIKEGDKDVFNRMKTSFENHDVMDDLVLEHYPIGDMPTEFLENISKEDLTKMLRSQQSKRSRAKSNKMDVDNYKTMMTGAVAEYLIRKVLGQPKSAGSGASTKAADYSDERIAELLGDKEKLAKAIRNVQSKISIAKHKTGHDANSDQFKNLLAEEAFYKGLRDNQAKVVSEEASQALETQAKAQELLASVSEEDLADPAKAADLLKQMQEMLASRK